MRIRRELPRNSLALTRRQPASAQNRIGGRELFAQNSPVWSGCTSMLGYWKLWIDCLKLGHEAQQVIAMRIARIARGGRGADAECRRMVSEKLAATTAAQSAAAAALAAGKGLDVAAGLALAPVQKAVRGNQRRLARAKRFYEITLSARRITGHAGLIRRILTLRARS
jgi:hypothetical protein